MKLVNMALVGAIFGAADAKYALKSDFMTHLSDGKWIESKIKQTEDPAIKKRNFYQEPGNYFNMENEEFGLHARNADARYSVSKKTDFPVNWSDHHDGSFGFMFSVRHGEQQTCGDAFIKLIGNHGHRNVKYHTHAQLPHLEDEERHANFNPEEFQPSSPYLFAFGPRYCENSSEVVLKFVDN